MQRLAPWIVLVLAGACAAPTEPPPPAVGGQLAVVSADSTPPPADADVDAPEGQVAEPAPPEPAPPAAAPADLPVDEPLPEGAEPSDPTPAVEEALPAGPQPGDLLPSPSPSVVRFVPFGPNEGTSLEDFASFQAMLHELYHEDLTPEREAALRQALTAWHVVDLTPAWINQVDGLDLSDPADVVRARAITNDWYVAQERYKKVALNGDPAELSERVVNSRVTVLRAWVRFWARELQKGTVERYRDRVDTLLRKMERLRAERRKGAVLTGEG